MDNSSTSRPAWWPTAEQKDRADRAAAIARRQQAVIAAVADGEFNDDEGDDFPLPAEPAVLRGLEALDAELAERGVPASQRDPHALQLLALQALGNEVSTPVLVDVLDQVRMQVLSQDAQLDAGDGR